jgi:hypothetical protein
MKLGSKIAILLLAICQNGWAQGFVNLDFENAHFIVDPSGNLPPNSVYASNAIPGWTAYVGGVPQTDIFSNLPSAGSAWVSLLGTNPPSPGIFSMEPAFQGRWSIFLQGFSGNTNGFTGGAPVVASIGQTGQIPASAESLLFWGNLSLSYGNIFDVSFNGQDLSLVTISNALNYTVYGADVSRFAGQTGQLLFSAGNNTYAELDNIQFSSVSITEPSAFALAALGALFVGFRRWRTSSRWNLR